MRTVKTIQKWVNEMQEKIEILFADAKIDFTFSIRQQQQILIVFNWLLFA